LVLPAFIVWKRAPNTLFKISSFVLYGKESVKIDLKRLSKQIIDYFGELEPCLSIDTLNATPNNTLHSQSHPLLDIRHA